MSEQTEQRGVEQITADPKPENKDTKKREKDPKKVAAGKKLAEYNKKAKEALAREMKREEKMKQKRSKMKIHIAKRNHGFQSYLLLLFYLLLDWGLQHLIFL